MIFLVFFLDVLLCMLPLISETAFTAITSLATIGYHISYAIPIILRLTVARKTFKQSEFNLGILSVPMGWISVVWLLTTSILFLLPIHFDADGG
jgi:amino acid transporter